MAYTRFAHSTREVCAHMVPGAGTTMSSPLAVNLSPKIYLFNWKPSLQPLILASIHPPTLLSNPHGQLKATSTQRSKPDPYQVILRRCRFALLLLLAHVHMVIRACTCMGTLAPYVVSSASTRTVLRRGKSTWSSARRTTGTWYAFLNVSFECMLLCFCFFFTYFLYLCELEMTTSDQII